MRALSGMPREVLARAGAICRSGRPAARLTFGNRTTSSGISPYDAPGFAAPPRDGCASIE